MSMTAPRFLQNVEFGEHAPAAVIDLTSAITEVAVRNPKTFKEYLGGDKPWLHDLTPALDENQFAAAMKGGMGAPGFHENLKTFVGLAGLDTDPAAFQEHLRDVARKRERLAEAENLLANTLKATPCTDDTFMVMVVTPGGGDFYDSAEDYFHDAGYDVFVTEMPRPSLCGDEKELAAWNQVFSAWQETHIPPFLHGTRPEPLAKLTSDELLADLRDGEEESITRSFYHWLENETGRHHDDAYDHLVDPEKTEEKLFAWENARLIGDRAFLTSDIVADDALEAIIREFNEAQTIVSYFEKRDALVLRDGATKDDCIAWCERHVEACRKDLAAIEENYRTPERVA